MNLTEYLDRFFAGCALTTSYLFIALLLSPFFSDGAFWWANLLLSFTLIVGLALGADVLNVQQRFGNTYRPGSLLILGAWIGFQPFFMAQLTRQILNFDPDSFLAPIFTLMAIQGAPAMIAMLAALRHPSNCNEQNQDSAPLWFSRRALVTFVGGMAIGITTAMPLLLNQEFDPVLAPGAIGAAVLAWAALSETGKWRIAAILLLVSVLVTNLFVKNELHSIEYRTALCRSYKLRVGDYYLSTAGRRILAKSDIRKHYEQVLKQIQDNEHPAASAIRSLATTLENLGEVETTGTALISTLKPLVSPTANRYIGAFLAPVDKIVSNGKGRIRLILRPDFKDVDRSAPLAPESDEKVTKFSIKSDLTLDITHIKNHTEIRIGPHNVKPASFWEFNETHTTPLVIRDVAAFVDAHLLALMIDDREDRVVIRVRAQGSVGDVVEEDLIVIDKRR